MAVSRRGGILLFRAQSFSMELSSNSSPGLLRASASVELHARTLFDEEVLGDGPVFDEGVLGDGPVECSTNTALVDKRPGAELLSDGFVECGTDPDPVKKLVEAEASRDGFEMCCAYAELVNKLPDVEALAGGFVDCTTELSASSAASSDHSGGSVPPFEDASTGLLEVPCSNQDTMPSHSVDHPD